MNSPKRRQAKFTALAMPVTALSLLLMLSSAALADVRIGGRVHADYAFYDEDVIELDDGGEFRRARLFASGELDDNWDYKLQLDFAGGDTVVKDAYIRYSGLPAGKLTIGNSKIPLSLEESSSSKYITFMERSIPFFADEPRRLSLRYDYGNGRWGMTASLFGEDPNDGNGGHGVAARFYTSPVNDDTRTLHLGLSGGIEQRDEDTVRLRIRPETHVTDVRLLDTGLIPDVDELGALGFEALGISGPWSLQAEWMNIDVNRDALPDLSFPAWYVSAAWFITGERRAYRDGEVRKVTPLLEGGAWEVALRYSNVNFTDKLVLGGESDNITLGVNWYPRADLRFMFNYVDVNTRTTLGDDDPDVYQFRVAWEF